MRTMHMELFTGTYHHIILVLLLLVQHALFAHTLSVTPPEIDQAEGDSEVHFFCVESDNSYSTDITWRDPHGNLYTPGEQGDEDKIRTDGGRLSVHNLVRTDSGNYECFRTSSANESAHGELLVYASPVVLNPMPIQEIYFGVTSLLTCSIDRGYPVGDVYWLRLDSTGDNIIAHVTPSYDPRFRIVEDGLQIEDVRSADEGLYRCFVQNSHGSDSFDIHAAFRVPPQPPLKYRNLTITLDNPVEINCSVTALPQPDFQWFYDSTNKPLPPSSWSSFYDDVMGISTLVHIFTREDLKNERTIIVLCVATNSYGRSEQYFNLFLEESVESPIILATTEQDFNLTGSDESTSTGTLATTTSPSTSTPAIIANEQEQDDGGAKDGEKEDTYGIIIGVAIASTVIVLGVFILLVFLLRHFYTCKKKHPKLSSRNHAVDESSGLDGNNPGMTSLHHEPIYSEAGGAIAARGQRFQSVDSGVSISSMASLLSRRTSHDSCSENTCILPQTPSSANTLSPSTFQLAPPSPSGSSNCETPPIAESEGIYHRLNHNLPHTHSSNSSSFSASHPLVCKTCSFSKLTASQQVKSTSTVEGNSASVHCSNCKTELQQQQCTRFASSKSQQRSHSLTTGRHFAIMGPSTPQFSSDVSMDGMCPNLAYETCKQKFSPSENDAPHVYETVA